MGRCRRAYLYSTDDGSNGLSALLRASAVNPTGILAENINLFTQEKQSFYTNKTDISL